MISIEMTGELPQLNADLEPAMAQIADLMLSSVRINFLVGGRPDIWEPLKATGMPSFLIKSGAMFAAIQMQHDGESATVSIDTGKIPYAAIHNFGGTIIVPARQKVSFVQRRYTGGFKKGHFMKGTVAEPGHLTKQYTIDMPARPFMLFQEEDKLKILEIVSSAIFSESTPI